MLELKREDYKLIIANMSNSWMIVDKTNVILNDTLLLEGIQGVISSISLAYKIRNHELASIFMDTSMGTPNGDCYIYVIVTDIDGDFTNWGLLPMSNCVFNAAYADEVVNYRNGEQLVYKCSDTYLDLQSYAELAGDYEMLPDIVFSYFGAMLGEILADDFNIITSRDEEIKWPVDEGGEEQSTENITPIKSVCEVSLDGHWLEFIGQ